MKLGTHRGSAGLMVW